MKIGIDIDNVLVALTEGFCEFYNLRYGANLKLENFSKYYLTDILNIPKEKEYPLWKEYYDSEMFEEMSLKKGAKESVNSLKRDHELVFITARNSEWKDKTLLFFKKHFPQDNFSIIFSGEEYGGKSKDEVCRELGINLLFEDHPDNGPEYAKKGIKVILFDQPWNKESEHENILRVAGWDEIPEKIESLIGASGKKGNNNSGENSEKSTEKYFADLLNGVRKEYVVARKARAKGLDPADDVEIPLAMSLAEKAANLIAGVYPTMNMPEVIDAITKRILNLEMEYGQLDQAVSFKIAEELAKERFCKFDSLLQAIEAGIRLGFCYNTLGVVSSPIEGFTELKLGKTRKGEDYFVAYFSGPIRSAGTTASCMALILIDYLRELFGYAKYDPDEKEVKRYVTENYDYHERVNNLQYLPTEEEIDFLAKNLPIEVSGEPSEKREVSNYKDLPRIDTNFIRGGMCLCFSEGLAQKAQKALRLLRGLQSKGFKSTGWEFLEGYLELHKKREKGTKDTSATYIKDLVAGRPVFGHPSKSGAFRFRYGRSRVNGFSAVSVHPATMGISDSFLSTGTQLKIEKPTKGCIITVCDSIDGPIVKLKNGSVKRVKTFEEAKKLYRDTEEIIYFGDILFPVGDVINRNYELLKAGYVEEWWNLELQKAVREKGEKFEELGVSYMDVPFSKAMGLSEKYGVPLHPEHIFYWSQISRESLVWLVDWLQNAIWRGKIVLPYEKSSRDKFAEAKRAMELAGIEHEVILDNVVIESETSRALLANLGIYGEFEEGKKFRDEAVNIIEKIKNIEEGEGALEIVNLLSRIRIKDKAGTFIGSRMGRPEKAKLRKLTGSPHGLFPIGEEGGRLRSVNEAVEVGGIKAEFPIYFCNKCKKETIYRVCESCNERTKKLHYCYECRKSYEGKCPAHDKLFDFSSRKIDSKYYFDKALKHLGFIHTEAPALIKGVRGTSSAGHDFENLAKAVLRAKYHINVNKDGTVRYDATEIPITHFKPREAGVSVEKLRSIGYTKDMYNKELESDNQILELMPHDILLPSCPETGDEKADDVFFNVANFIDELLEKFYKQERVYNLKKKEDLVGKLVACMSPHNCASVVGRIAGFSKVQGLVASPFMHAAMRRDCDGDEAAIMLLMDVLLNFSRKFLPAHRGGTQDAPLVLNARIRAGEVDDQILDFELEKYPLELYEMAEQGKHSSELKIVKIKEKLKEGVETFFGDFTHDTSDFNAGVINSSYKVLPTMGEKVAAQMELVTKIRAVDTGDVARLIIERHFIRDIRGNLRKFSQQEFRCVKCNTKFRRPPLSGECTKCKGKIIFTISEGSIMKYVAPALELANKFEVPSYVKQGLELTKLYIESIFGKEKEKQEDLKKWF